MKRIIAATLFVCLSLTSKAQENYPADFFRSPLDIPLILAGTFGELRSNHFHSGIDIKTQQRQGLPVYAIADGTVSRIKVSHWGYGKALYVAHPNGYTSVYAHLQKYGPGIEEFVKDLQYDKKSYEVESFPEYGAITVKKGDIIAYTGNTGGSSGPHLHFEIRSSISEKPTNPLLYGLEVRDATNPVIEELYAYPLSNDAVVNQSQEKIKITFTRQADGNLLADPVTASGTIGFGIVSYDRQDLAANQNGVYSVEQKVNGRMYSAFNFEKFSFGETRYINTLIDYPHYGKYRDRIQKCFKDDGNHLDIYQELYNQGKIQVNEGLDYQVSIEVRDLMGNITRLLIPVQGKKEDVMLPREEATTPYFIAASKPSNFDLGAARVFFPANTFYKDFFIELEKGTDTVRIHDNTIPAHRNFTLTFDVKSLDPAQRKNTFIARLDEEGKPQYYRTYKRAETFTARTRNLGRYTLAMDTVPPTIRPKNFKPRQWLTNYRYLSLQIADDLSGIDTYSATLNGQWILLEYEPKTRTITYNFDDKISTERQCELKVVVTDNVGNESTFECTFFRK